MDLAPAPFSEVQVSSVLSFHEEAVGIADQKALQGASVLETSDSVVSSHGHDPVGMLREALRKWTLSHPLEAKATTDHGSCVLDPM